MVLITSLFNSFISLGSAATLKPFSSKVKLKPVLVSLLIYAMLDIFILRLAYPGFLIKILCIFYFHRFVLLRNPQFSLIYTVLTLNILAVSNVMTAVTRILFKNEQVIDKIVTGFDQLHLLLPKFGYALFFVLFIRFIVAKSCKNCAQIQSYKIKLLLVDAGILLTFALLLNLLLRYTVSHASAISTIPNLSMIFYVLVFLLILLCYSLIFLIHSFWLRTQNFSRVKYEADLDPMTGVYNRRSGLQLLHALYCRAKAKNTNFVLCFFDINNLKVVNDRFGHPEGDKLILTVAEAAREALRENDFIIRYGGDEFIIAFANCSLSDAKRAWNRISLSIEKRNMNADSKYYMSASAGFSSFDENRNLGISDLINLADNEMYKVKRSFKQYTKTEEQIEV